MVDDNNKVVEGTSGADKMVDRGATDDTRNVVAGHEGDDNLRGFRGDDEIDGGAGDDHLEGNYGNDILRGGFGNDTLYGGCDDDVMIGGAGRDTFIIRMHEGGVNRIKDFNVCEDRIQPVFSRNHLSQVYNNVKSCFGKLEELPEERWNDLLAGNEKDCKTQLAGSTFRKVGSDLVWDVPVFVRKRVEFAGTQVIFEGFFTLNRGAVAVGEDGAIDPESTIDVLLRRANVDLEPGISMFDSLEAAMDLTRSGHAPERTENGPGGSAGYGTTVNAYYRKGDKRDLEVNRDPNSASTEAVRIDLGRVAQRVDVTVQRFYGSEAGGNIERLQWIAMVKELDGHTIASRVLHEQVVVSEAGAFHGRNPGTQTFTIATDRYFTHLVLVPLAYEGERDSSDFILSNVEVISAPKCCNPKEAAFTAAQLEGPFNAPVEHAVDDELTVTITAWSDHAEGQKEPRALTRRQTSDQKKPGLGVQGANASGIAAQLGFNPVTRESETMRFQFNRLLAEATVSVSNLFFQEAGGVEQLRWTAKRDNIVVGEGTATADKLAKVLLNVRPDNNPHAGELRIGGPETAVLGPFNCIVMAATDYATRRKASDSSDYFITKVACHYCAEA